MRFDHGDAFALETLVRRVHSCERFGMGGFINADYFQEAPFDAAWIVLSPIWKLLDAKELEAFLFKWEDAFRNESSESVDVKAYVEDLRALVNRALPNG